MEKQQDSNSNSQITTTNNETIIKDYILNNVDDQEVLSPCNSVFQIKSTRDNEKLGEEQKTDRNQRWSNERQKHDDDHHLDLTGVGEERVQFLASSLWFKGQNTIMVDFFLANSVLSKDIGKNTINRIFCIIIENDLNNWLRGL